MHDFLKRSAELEAIVRKAQQIQAMAQGYAPLADQIAADYGRKRTAFELAMSEMQRVHDIINPALRTAKLLNCFETAHERADRLGIQRDLPKLHLDALRWHSEIDPIIDRLKKHGDMTTSFKAMYESFLAWQSSADRLVNRFSEVDLIIKKNSVAERLLAPNRAFTKFAQTTVEQIEQSTDSRRSWALGVSLNVAEEQLTSMSDLLASTVTLPDDTDDASAERELRAPVLQQYELLQAIDTVEGENQNALIAASPTILARELTRRFLMAIVTCNTASKVAGHDEIFKPTTRAMEVYADMPWIQPMDMDSFADFVDCLYFLIYEGAGKDNLRFQKKHGGPIEDDDFDFVLCIKHFRNKLTRHDADHGKVADIKKSWNELSQRLQWLGLNHLPVTEDDFRLLHLSLLQRAHEFVNKIIVGLT